MYVAWVIRCGITRRILWDKVMTQMTLGISVPEMQGQEEEEEEKCEYCDKDKHKFSATKGDNVGKSGKLSRRIISDNKNHSWYVGFRSIAAHHIICSEAMDNDESRDICRNFGYDINHKNNGVMLPSKMNLACQLFSPLHRGGHSIGSGDGLAYPDAVKSKIQPILDSAEGGDYCSNPQALVKKFDKVSTSILKKIDSFSWTITADGKDYKPGGKGCSGVNSVSKKPNRTCPVDRNHLLKHNNKTIKAKKIALTVGT